MDYIIIGLLIAAIICIILVLAAVKKNNGNSEIERLEGIKRDIGESQRILRQELSDTTHRSISVLGDTVAAREKKQMTPRLKK